MIGKYKYIDTDHRRPAYLIRIRGYAEYRAQPMLSQKPGFRHPQIPTLELYDTVPLHA